MKSLDFFSYGKRAAAAWEKQEIGCVQPASYLSEIPKVESTVVSPLPYLQITIKPGTSDFLNPTCQVPLTLSKYGTGFIVSDHVQTS